MSIPADSGKLRMYNVIPRVTTKKLQKNIHSKVLQINQNEILKYI